MELLYVFVKKIREDKYGVGFNLSNNYDVIYNKIDKKICIYSKKRNFSEFFFGVNIVNVNAIVGKNGVGKTTLLNILGLKKIDRRVEYGRSEWFAVYHIYEDVFAIEGVNSDLLKNSPIHKENDYFFYFKLNEINDKFEYHIHDEKIDKAIGKLKIFHFPVMKERNPDYQRDQNLSFERFYMDKNIKWVYKYLVNDYRKFNDGDSTGKLTFIIGRDFSNNNYSTGERLDLYEDISGFYTDISFFDNKVDSILKNEKKLFIIRMLEKLINQHMVLSVSKSMPESIDENINKSDFLKFISLIEEKYSNDLKDYEGIKKFLMSKLDDFISLAEEIHGGSIEMNIKLIVSILEGIPESKFLNVGNHSSYICEIDLDSYNNDIFNLLNERSKKCIVNPFVVKFPEKSDGELSIINKISSIYGAIDNNSNGAEEYFIIFLDEIDAHLHPEWSRCFLSMLIDVLARFNQKFQLIVASHYPYIISDLPCDNILKIEKLMNGGFQITNSKHGFGSNMYDILNDNFFLSSPIGEFANKKILEIVKILSSNKEIDEGNNIKQVIDLLGDPIIKKNLMHRYNEKFKNKINKIQEIELLEERLKILKLEVDL